MMAHSRFVGLDRSMKNEGIGSSVARREGPEKLTGKAQYVADQVLPGRIYGVTVRSKVAHGRILAIRYGEGIPWEEFTIVTAKDIAAMGWHNRVESIEPDQPFLADGIINHAEEPIVLLAHADRHLLERARRAVLVEVEELPAVLDIDQALACVQPVGGRDNLFKEILIEKGDPGFPWAQAAHVVGTLPSDGLPARVREITDQLLMEFTTIGFLSDDGTARQAQPVATIAAPVFDHHAQVAMIVAVHPLQALARRRIDFIGRRIVRVTAAISGR